MARVTGTFNHSGTVLGDDTYTLTVQATDTATGQAGAVSSGLAFEVDTVGPTSAATTITTDTGLVDGITSDNTLVFGGTAEANNTIEVFLNDGSGAVSLGTTTADGAGDWTFNHTGSVLADDTYTLTAQATDTATGQAGAVSAGLVFEVDTSGPASAVTAIAADTGLADGITSDNTLVFSGTSEANNTVEVFLDDGSGAVSLGTTTADGAGDWTFNHTGTVLADDTYTVTAQATDTATGQAGAVSAGLAFEVDTAGPASAVTAIAADTGLADGITSDNTLIFSGTAEANNTVEVFLDDGSGAVSLGTTTANGSGAWTFDHRGTVLADDTYTLTAQATDVATGQAGAVSAGLAFEVDTAGPASAITSFSTDTGLADGITSDNTLVFTGTSEADNTIEVFLDDGSGAVSLGTTTADGAGDWTFNHSGTVLADDTYTLTVQATDTATGQAGAVSAGLAFEVDTVGPASAATTITTDTGLVDGITSDNTLIFSGTAEANNTVEVFLNDGSGAVSLGTTTADGAGDWAFNHTGTVLADDTYTLTVQATDTATGQAGAVSAGLAFEVDTAGPASAITSFSTDTGLSDGDHQPITRLSSAGTSEANNTIEVFLNDGSGAVSLGTTTADGAGDWTFNHTGTVLADDTYTLDGSGN